MGNNHVFRSKDGVEYTLTVSEDVVQLNDGQVELVKEKIEGSEASVVESNSGVPIKVVTDEQSQAVIKLIESIFKDLSIEEILELELVDFTGHARQDRLSVKEILIERDWDQGNVEHEIVESLKRAFRVEQIRVRFDPETKESWKRFGFRIRGFKGKNRDESDGLDDAQVVINFEKDPEEFEETIMVITILEPDFKPIKKPKMDNH
ncbi:hypothetical protein [Pseudalkalibacillus sp. JSM 102089]|uniref:hypothetical protein n=1 Tax=Pseudalkalibacillus sp. JSM 102089 TaxID=3229856 RepID=UPI0035245089